MHDLRRQAQTSSVISLIQLVAKVLSQVEVWARSKDEYLNDLVFLDDDSRKAVALVGNFMRMLECRIAIERLHSDERFQEDASDPQVQKAVAECTEHPQNIRKCDLAAHSYVLTHMICQIFIEREDHGRSGEAETPVRDSPEKRSDESGL